MAYEKQNDALNEIEKNSEEDLSSSSEFLTPDQYPIFWKELLTALQELSGTGKDDVIKQGDIKKEKDEKGNIYQSLLSYIEEKCDLPDETEEGRSISLSTFYRQIKEDAGKKDKFFWNESLEAAVRHFLEFFTFKDDQVLIKIPSDSEDDAHSITVGTIREANAGYHFTPSEWVRPFWNINDKSYNEVRGHDQVNDILRNENKLQYTRKIDETYKWIRLLMPQYGRRVETEDLNRNWWVIAQVIAAISDFLFDDDSPIENMFDYFLRELTELWENMLYLWLEVAMASQKTNDGVRVIVLPLQADSNRTDKRFDNFDEIISYTEVKNLGDQLSFDGLTLYRESESNKQKEKIFNHIKYLAEEYSEQNLCIIPYFRMENYKHNYYVGEYYPYMFIFNQKNGDAENMDNWDIYSIYEENDGIPLIISPKYEAVTGRFSDKIYGFKYNKDEETYSYQYPFSALKKTATDEKRILMYGGIRTEVKVTFDKSASDIIPSTVTIFVNDIISEGVGENETQQYSHIGSYSAPSSDIDTTPKSQKIKMTYGGDQGWTKSNFAIGDIQKKDCYNIDRAAYLGECATWKGKTSSITTSTDLFVSNSVVLKLGNYLPIDNAGYIMSVMEVIEEGNKVQYFTSMYGNVTVATAGKTSTKYYKFNWKTYDPDKDGDANTKCTNATAFCFAKEEEGGIEQKSCQYLTETRLEEDGLEAVSSFIAKMYKKGTGIGEKPLYLTTCVGLTPWQGTTNNAIYWDSAFIAHMFFYIPTSDILQSLEEPGIKIDTTSYDEAYENAVFGTTLNSEVKVEKNGKEITIGKIVGRVLINRYEGYPGNYGATPYIDKNDPTKGRINPYYGTGGTGSRWRQFFITNDNNLNYLKRNVYNKDDPEDSSVEYELKLAGYFSGTVRYFDVYLYREKITNQKQSPIYNEPRCQVTSANIKIDDKYTPSKEKMVRRDEGVITPFNNANSLVTENVGFYEVSGENPIDKIAGCIGEKANYFHGGSNLIWSGDVGYQCVYAQDSDS